MQPPVVFRIHTSNLWDFRVWDPFMELIAKVPSVLEVWGRVKELASFERQNAMVIRGLVST